MTIPGTQAPLRIRQSSKRQLQSTGILAAVLCAYVLAGATGVIPEVIMWCGVLVFGSILVVGFHNVLRAARASWELTLDHDGVTVRGYPTTPWADLAEVRLIDARPRWLFALTKRYQFIAFIGHPGVTLPSLPSARERDETSRHNRARERMYGTQLVLAPNLFDANTDTVLTAVQHFGNLPITRA